MPDTEPDYLDTSGVAAMLHVDRATVWRYIASGRLTPDTHFGRSPVFRPATIRAYIDGMSPQAQTAWKRRGKVRGGVRPIRIGSADLSRKLAQ